MCSGACRAYSQGTHERKDEDGLLLEFPCNSTRMLRVILLGLLPCNQLGTCPLDYIKEGRVPSRISQPNTKRRAPYLIAKQDVGFSTLVARTCINLLSRVLAHTFKFLVSQSRSSTAQSTTSGTPLVGLPV
jgi:hypothetical protein